MTWSRRIRPAASCAAAVLFVLLDACSGPADTPRDGGGEAGIDAGHADAAMDAGADAAVDPAPEDGGFDAARGEDAGDAGSSGDGGRSDAEWMIAAGCALSAEWQCAGPARCGCGAGPPVEECFRRLFEPCEGATRAFFDSPAAVHYRVDHELAASCEATRRAAFDACIPHPSPPPRDCLHMLVDLAQIGETCHGWTRYMPLCADGHGICDYIDNTCKPNGDAVGESCIDACGGADSLACIDGVCELARGPGEVCAHHNECDSGLFCATDGRCRAALGAEGDPCAEDVECASGLRCEDGACSRPATRACTPGGELCAAHSFCAPGSRCFAPSPAGIACAHDEDCEAGLACRAGVCGSLPAEGELCEARCAAGLRCYADPDDPAALRCNVPRSDGAACSEDAECQLGSYCIGEPRQCTPSVAVGEPCGRYEHCDDRFAECTNIGDEARCVALPGAAGAPCPLGRCAGDLVCVFQPDPGGGPEGYECVPAPAAGESCAGLGACSGGAICRDVPTGTCFPEACCDFIYGISPDLICPDPGV